MENIKDYYKFQKNYLKEKISHINKKLKFVVVQVGDVEASNRYVRNKLKDCEDVGIESELIKLPENITNDDLINTIVKLNTSDITAYMIQLPLPAHINPKIVKLISYDKDADAFNNIRIHPCTPQGIITYLERQNYNFENKNALIIGRSEIVGKPMAKLLLEKNCNVTILHSHTSEHNKFRQIELADLIVCATGNIGTLHHDYQYYSPIIFDVGINFDDNGKLVGDCYPNLKRVAFQSPVPGGVGLLTRLQLLENIYELYLMNGDKNQND